jgi:molybdate transport system ATP-binding protein
MVLMSEGRIAAVGPMSEVLTRLDLRPMTGRFEAGVVVEAEVAGHDERYQLTTLMVGAQPLLVPGVNEARGTRVRLRVRARDVALALERPVGISIQNVLPGRVTELSREQGPFVEVNVDVGAAVLTARLTRRAAEAMALAPGQSIFALIKAIALDRVARLDADGG